jgi:hypothetical protein
MCRLVLLYILLLFCTAKLKNKNHTCWVGLSTIQNLAKFGCHDYVQSAWILRAFCTETKGKIGSQVEASSFASFTFIGLSQVTSATATATTVTTSEQEAAARNK